MKKRLHFVHRLSGPDSAPSQAAESIDGFRSVCSNDTVALKGRLLAIDYGEKNIGLACSDELGLTVRPLPSIHNRGRKELLKTLRDTIHQMDIRGLVIGMPFNMDGSQGDSAFRIEQFMDTLKSAIRVPLVSIDERLSTMEALELWRGMNPRQQKKYRTADSLAAAIILERYLKEN